MSFQIERGLFQSDFTDFHAVLGVPVDAKNDEILKRYRILAKNLHPDAVSSKSKEEQELAKNLFSKLVSPAYKQLSNDKDRNEQTLILGMKVRGQQANQTPVEIHSPLAKQLESSPDIDQAYRTAIKELADKQYASMERALELTGEISELNLVYLMRKQSESTKSPAKKPAAEKGKPSAPSRATTVPPPPPPKKSPAEAYYRRAEELIEKENLNDAILELRDSIKLDPRNSSCHSLLAEIYLTQKQATMAKVHINKALELNPKDPKALEGQKKLEKLVRANKKAAISSKSDNKGGEGIKIFGFTIGGGKKK